MWRVRSLQIVQKYLVLCTHRGRGGSGNILVSKSEPCAIGYHRVVLLHRTLCLVRSIQRECICARCLKLCRLNMTSICGSFLSDLALHLSHRGSRTATSTQLRSLRGLCLFRRGAGCPKPSPGLNRIHEVLTELLGNPVIRRLIIR